MFPPPAGLETERAAPVVGEALLMVGDETAMCATGGPDESNDMTVVGFVLASEFWRDQPLRASSDVIDGAPPTDEYVSRRLSEGSRGSNVSRRSAGGGGLVPGMRRGTESSRNRPSEPKREVIDMERVGDGGIGRTLASSSAYMPDPEYRSDSRMLSSSSATEIWKRRWAASDERETSEDVRERERRESDAGRDPESMVEAGYDRRTSGIGSEGYGLLSSRRRSDGTFVNDMLYDRSDMDSVLLNGPESTLSRRSGLVPSVALRGERVGEREGAGGPGSRDNGLYPKICTPTGCGFPFTTRFPDAVTAAMASRAW